MCNEHRNKKKIPARYGLYIKMIKTKRKMSDCMILCRVMRFFVTPLGLNSHNNNVW